MSYLGATAFEIFESEGVSPAKVSLGHSDDSDALAYLLGLAGRRYLLGMDHAFYGVPQDAAVPFETHVRYIKDLADAGFIDRLLLSTDWELGDRELLNPDGLLIVTGRIIPYLRALGLSEQQVRTITVANPMRFFARG